MPDENALAFYRFLLELAKVGLAAVAGVWAYRRFVLERVHAPQIEFTIACTLLGPQAGRYVAEIELRFRNRGQVRHKIQLLKLHLLGLKAGTGLRRREKCDAKLGFKEIPAQLDFPIEVMKCNDLIPPDWKYFFIEPKVDQTWTHIVDVPANLSHLLVISSFKYPQNQDRHTARRVFPVPVPGTGTGHAERD